jgi:hypothetical protein
VENLIDQLIQYQQQFRILHWQTKSFARHQAYGSFYGTLGDLIDKFVETHMGKYGRIKTSGQIQLSNMNEIQIKDYLEEIEQFLVMFGKDYDKVRDSDLLNIRDEMLGEVNKLKYLLTLE